MSRAVGFWLGVLFVFAGCMVIWQINRMQDSNQAVADAGSHQSPDEDAVVENPQLTEFELIDQRGNRINSKSLEGQVWIGSFFFAKCPGTCYHQNIKLSELHTKYAERGLQIFSITCDPSNDDPVALASYASRFNADVDSWKFLTPNDGDIEYLKTIGRECLGVAIDQGTHTDRVVLFDPTGESVGAYSVLQPDQFAELDEKIEALLTAATQDSEATPSDESQNEQAEDELDGSDTAADSGGAEVGASA